MGNLVDRVVRNLKGDPSEARKTEYARNLFHGLKRQGKIWDFKRYVEKTVHKNREEYTEYDNNGKKYSIRKL